VQIFPAFREKSANIAGCKLPFATTVQHVPAALPRAAMMEAIGWTGRIAAHVQSLCTPARSRELLAVRSWRSGGVQAVEFQQNR
jgi:hypothetical protein